MAATPKLEKYAEVEERPSGKARGGKLARRARSFKEDFLEKLSQMRSPGVNSTSTGSGGGVVGTGGGVGSNSTTGNNTIVMRTGSPSLPRVPRDKPPVGDIFDKNPLRDLHIHVRQVQLALLHFRDVVSKKKLEMLPGNGTIVLDTVTTIHTVLKSYLLYENSSTLGSATNQVYQALARLLKLCDDVLLHGNQSSPCPALDADNVSHVIGLVEDAVKNLVSLAHEKISNKQKPAPININNNRTSGYNTELTSQRNSLPDIPLTPRERQILEQTAASSTLVRSSHSTESILRDSSPPPKPPFPERTNLYDETNESSSSTTTPPPPPLPPKKRTRAQQLLDESDILLSSSLDRVSLRSRSPEDSSSLLSASAGSLDSALNHSRDEDEIRAIMGPNDESLNDNMDLSLMATIHGIQVNGTNNGSCWENSETNLPTTMLLGQQTPHETVNPFTGIECKNERLSTQTQESGFVSTHSQRSSSQSYTTASSFTSKRSSQQSSVSFNSQSFSTQQQLFSQQKLVENENSTMIQRMTTSSKSASVISTSMTGNGDPTILDKLEIDENTDSNGLPPALPEKRSKRKKERHPSQYDNVPENEHLSTCSLHSNSADSPDASRPPPLPLKKRHMFQSVAYSVMAYMEMFGNCSHSNNDFISGIGTRHSVAAYNSMQAEWQQHEMALTTTQSCSSMVHTMTSLREGTGMSINMSPLIKDALNRSSLPPALPPKRSRSIKCNITPTQILTKPTISMQSINTPDPLITSTPVKEKRDESSIEKNDKTSPVIFNFNNNDNIINNNNDINSNNNNNKNISLEVLPVRPESKISIDENTVELCDTEQDNEILNELEITKYLVVKKPEEDGPDIRGGHPDALLVHATKANKHDEKETDFLYQEAFLTTYRTFMSPLGLIQKLHKRHQRFSTSSDVVKQRAAREAFSLLVRVVSDLTMSDLDDILLKTLTSFSQQLVCSGDLTMAKALRVKILEKYAQKQLQSSQPILSSLSISTKQASLLDFKSEQIAEQMTLLDAELFMKIEIPEVLIWAQEQNEERSPNLTRFTEHFNKMSYWARSRILEHRMENEAKEREKYVVKFIKIMKHLRKINNFNSYLALLSALDSAPIRRLEWQKHITEGLKEYCALIDSSSSFRAYRQALAETQSPCIPYIGLVLQDLTFVHIGNSDLLPDGTINFSKRWQQFNIVENMKRFKKGTYSFKKHERIITFFNNFSDFLCEEAMWQISESIKPRGGKKNQSQN
ncbi:guanine nucleotide-releasing factor 2 isoform X2 [Aphidius gifuensis]|uniref:guanine nucleotide-releasing factor 2 isoform X2 n=1 Tax=Aphidius gifuensis TaxID=684658 RepID=UPI001CDC7C27|nr:guanine nucleotide-releasing factor 2 isoform X2 [Aphidius gifuensis]